MNAIHNNDETMNYQQNMMNMNEDKNLMLYIKKNNNGQPQYLQSKEHAYYNDTINTSKIMHVGQGNMRINEPRIIKNKVLTSDDTSANMAADTYTYIDKDIGAEGYKETYTDIRTVIPTATQETLYGYVPTNENLHLSQQSLDMYNQGMSKSKGTMEHVCFENINRMHQIHKYNTNKQLIENDSSLHKYYYDYNALESADPNKQKTYLKNLDRQQINTCRNFTNNENHIYPTKAQQIISNNIQHPLPDTYKNNMHFTFTETTSNAFQKGLIHNLQSQEEHQQESNIDIQNKQSQSNENKTEQTEQIEQSEANQEEVEEEEEEEDEEEEEETEKEKELGNEEMMEQENYTNSLRQMECYLQKNEENLFFPQNKYEKQNNFESSKINGNIRYQLGMNEQEVANYYKQYTEQTKETLNMYETCNNEMQVYLHKQKYSHGNNGNMPNQTQSINQHLGTVQQSQESYNQLEHFGNYTQNVPFSGIYNNTSTGISTKEYTNNNEANNQNEINVKESSVERSDGVNQMRAINATAESLINSQLMLQQQQQQDVNEFSQYNINQYKKDVSNMQEQQVTHNVGYYSNMSVQPDESVNKQCPKNITNTLSMNSMTNMQSRLNEVNNMPSMNYNSFMSQQNQHFGQDQTQKALIGNEYLNNYMNGQYSAKDIKEFMLEPKLYTKMNLDMPELMDGLTIVQGDKGETDVQTETIMKYKDTWRLMPGKSLNANENGNTNQRENEIQLFQQYLDRSNQNTQQMLLNSSFNSLTGRLTVHPFANNQELENASNIHNYKDQAAAFPTSYYQPTNSLAYNKTLPSTLYPTAINEANNGQDWNLNGTKQFISTDESRDVRGINQVKMLNKLTGADQLNAINNVDSVPMNVANDSHFSVDIPENTDSLINSTINMSKENQPQQQHLKKRTLKKPALPLCGSNMLTYDLKTYISQTVKNYFKGKQAN